HENWLFRARSYDPPHDEPRCCAVNISTREEMHCERCRVQWIVRESQRPRTRGAVVDRWLQRAFHGRPVGVLQIVELVSTVLPFRCLAGGQLIRINDVQKRVPMM